MLPKSHMFYDVQLMKSGKKFIVVSGLDGSSKKIKGDTNRNFKTKELALKYAKHYMDKHNFLTEDDVSYWD